MCAFLCSTCMYLLLIADFKCMCALYLQVYVLNIIQHIRGFQPSKLCTKMIAENIKQKLSKNRHFWFRSFIGFTIIKIYLTFISIAKKEKKNFNYLAFKMLWKAGYSSKNKIETNLSNINYTLYVVTLWFFTFFIYKMITFLKRR